jgi:hypothetical protein
MSPSLETLCLALVRGHLLPASEVRALRRRWRDQMPGSADDPDGFARWLVDQRYLTSFQVEAIRRGRVDQLCVGPYRLIDRITSGPLRGAYHAVHPLGQQVALWVLPASRAKAPGAVRRFERQVRRALKLSHPEPLPTLQAGEAGGRHYLVTDYPESDAPAAAEGVDVELVPIDPPDRESEGSHTWTLTRRDLLFLAIGAGGVLVAEGLGLVLARLRSASR